MSEAHWAIKNDSVTQGEAGLDMLGFRPSWEDQIPLDFGFEQADEGRIHTALMSNLPRWLEQFDPDAAPTMDTLLALSADDTAATESQFRRALGELESGGEIEVLTPTGAQKRRSPHFDPGTVSFYPVSIGSAAFDFSPRPTVIVRPARPAASALRRTAVLAA